MKFHVISANTSLPNLAKDQVFLKIDNWNDYSFVTSFAVYLFDKGGQLHQLPDVKIGFVGQTTQVATYEKLGEEFDSLPEGFFSLGVNVEYYRDLYSDFDQVWRLEFLTRLKDVVWDQEILNVAQKEEVFQISLLRTIGINTIRDQFSSVLRGEVLLTNFDFSFRLPPSDIFAGFDLSFSVKANSTPSTNMHALIGRNGVGKTTLLNSMVSAKAKNENTEAYFYSLNGPLEIEADCFSSLISVAFSAFDPFQLPEEKEDSWYHYIGLTDYASEDGAIIKSKNEISDEFAKGLDQCFEDERRRFRWVQAIETLQSDDNFAEMDLLSLVNLRGEKLNARALYLIGKMSSGHSIAVLTMTLLVAKIKEKTLVLFDEPESHLHPPLLSALMRSLSQLLHTRNAVAIIATHSPVVLQEIPKSCVWKVYRSKVSSEKKRPSSETFGENVGTLTREVFGLEVERSGFHTVLSDLVSKGGTFNQIMDELEGSLGAEARGILKAMVVNRDTEQT